MGGLLGLLGLLGLQDLLDLLDLQRSWLCLFVSSRPSPACSLCPPFVACFHDLELVEMQTRYKSVCCYVLLNLFSNCQTLKHNSPAISLRLILKFPLHDYMP